MRYRIRQQPRNRIKNRHRHASYVIVQIENLTTCSTPDQYPNSLIRGDASRLQRFSRYKVYQ